MHYTRPVAVWAGRRAVFEPMTRTCPTQTPHEQGTAGKCSRAKVLPDHVVCRLQAHTKTLTVFRIQTKRISPRRNVGTEQAVLQAPCRVSTSRAGACSLFWPFWAHLLRIAFPLRPPARPRASSACLSLLALSALGEARHHLSYFMDRADT